METHRNRFKNPWLWFRLVIQLLAAVFLIYSLSHHESFLFFGLTFNFSDLGQIFAALALICLAWIPEFKTNRFLVFLFVGLGTIILILKGARIIEEIKTTKTSLVMSQKAFIAASF